VEDRDIFILHPPNERISGIKCVSGTEPAVRNAKTSLTKNLPFHFPRFLKKDREKP
jgi:hypothetical protein